MRATMWLLHPFHKHRWWWEVFRVCEAGFLGALACLGGTMSLFSRCMLLVFAKILSLGLLLTVRPYRLRSAFVIDAAMSSISLLGLFVLLGSL